MLPTVLCYTSKGAEMKSYLALFSGFFSSGLWGINAEEGRGDARGDVNKARQTSGPRRTDQVRLLRVRGLILAPWSTLAVCTERQSSENKETETS